MFEPDQKVIYIGVQDPSSVFNLPKDREVVTILKMDPNFQNGWFLKEYPENKDGHPQGFFTHELYPHNDDKN
jgi:hypothetical protein